MADKYTAAVVVLAVILVLSLGAVGWAVNEEETELSADEILLDDLNQQVEATGNVNFKRAGMRLESDYLKAEENMEALEAQGNVVVTRGESRITSQRLDLDYSKSQAVFTGEPKLVGPESTIRGDKFRFDLDTNDLEVMGSAGFENEDQEMTGQSDELYYNDQKQLVTLVGNVKIWRGNRRIEAPEVEVDLEKRQIRTKGKSSIFITED